jgi:hypothetical protein
MWVNQQSRTSKDAPAHSDHILNGILTPPAWPLTVF